MFFFLFFSEPGAAALCEWLKKKKVSSASDKKICCRSRSRCIALSTWALFFSFKQFKQIQKKKVGTFIRNKGTTKTAVSNVHTSIHTWESQTCCCARGKI